MSKEIEAELTNLIIRKMKENKLTLSDFEKIRENITDIFLNKAVLSNFVEIYADGKKLYEKEV